MTSNLATLLPFTVIQSMKWTSGKLWKIASPVTQLPLCNDDTEKCCPSLPISGGSSVRRILGVFPNFPDGKKNKFSRDFDSETMESCCICRGKHTNQKAGQGHKTPPVISQKSFPSIFSCSSLPKKQYRCK